MRSQLRATILFFAVLSPLPGLFGQTIRVLVATGEVTLQAPGDASARPAVKGDVVPLGTRLVTGPGSRLVLTPFPGITSMLAENSTLVVERAQSTTAPGSTVALQQATLDLKTGALVSDLEKQAGVAYDYSVKTPRGVAGARGTIYAVAVDVSGVESVLVSDGSIQITLTDGTALALTPGSASITRPGQPAAAVARLSDLSPAEQAILQAVMETTLETLAAAIEAGVDLQPDALRLTLQFALDFGFEIDAELLAALQAALAAEEVEKFGVLFNRIDTVPTTTNNTESSTVVTETAASTTPPENSTTPPPDDAETAFANSLSPTRKAAFLKRPADIRAKIIQLNDADYTNLVLDPDPVTGIEFTDTQLRDGLDNLAYLKVHDPAGFEFLKDVSGGTGLPNAETAPSPTDYSLSAFATMGETWSALSPEDQTAVTTLGAGGSVMNTSPGYIGDVLDQFAALTPDQQTAITETGWGAYLTQLAGDSTLQAALDTVVGYTPAQRATIQAFGLSPQAFINNNQSAGISAAAYYYGNPTALLEALAALTPAQQTTLRRLDLQDELLNYRTGYYAGGETYVSLTVAESLNLTLDFFAALTPAEQNLLLSLDAGHWVFENAPESYISRGDTTALALTRSILGELSTLSATQKEAAFTLGLLDGVYLDDTRLTSATLAEAINTYLAAPAFVQRFLRDEFHGSTILDVTVGTDDNESIVRPLSEITAILTALTTLDDGETPDPLAAENLDTLRDMEIGETLASPYFFPVDSNQGGEVLTLVTATNAPSPAGLQLKAMVNFYGALPANQKQTLVELGILGATESNFATFLADFEGLGSLLHAYAAVPGLNAKTQRIPEYGEYKNYQGRSFFAPRANVYDSPYSNRLYYVSFTSDDDLYVGATRVLRIISGTTAQTDTFTTGEGKSLYLRAADLIELTDVRFSTNIRTITMSAVTLNFYGTAFREGVVASLNSRDGVLNFGGVQTGAVNFVSGNSYGGTPFSNLPSFNSATRGNLAIGTLASPAPMPTYTPPPAP